MTASTITVVLPVPGGPWMKTHWPAVQLASSETARFCGGLGIIPSVIHLAASISFASGGASVCGATSSWARRPTP